MRFSKLYSLSVGTFNKSNYILLIKPIVYTSPWVFAL